MRTVQYQLNIHEKSLEDYIKKLQTSLNNLKAKRGHTEYLRYKHVEDDALTLAFEIDKYMLLCLMRDSTDLEGYG